MGDENTPQRPSFKEMLLQTLLSPGLLVSLTVLASFVLIYVLARGPGTENGQGAANGVADVAYARGLITLFFAVGTISIALLLTISVITAQDDKAVEKFNRGKEVLGVLIGIFGTIVGFYFGSASMHDSKGTSNQTTNITGSNAPKNQSPTAP